MSISPQPNGQPVEPNAVISETTQAKPKTQRPKTKRPNYAQIHAKLLPLAIHPLPAFHPSNPISLLRLAYTWISHVLFPLQSHPEEQYIGYFSPETRSVHVTDPRHARALWEMGFFGKGTLSRSEPSWLQREKVKVRQSLDGRPAAEDATRERREERRLFKLERARLEREKVERQRFIEEGKLDPDEDESTDTSLLTESSAESATDSISALDDIEDEYLATALEAALTITQNGHVDATAKEEAQMPDAELLPAHGQRSPQSANLPPPTHGIISAEDSEPDLNIEDQEHLQLTLEEAFFLAYGLGVLSVYPYQSPELPPPSPKTTLQPLSPPDLMELFCQYSFFPPSFLCSDRQPDDPFLINYVAYHHFRSLGWVVRPGSKFAVDYLLYNRGPVFSHSEFAVLIIPAYTDRYWNTPGGRARRRVWEKKDWWWLHCVNRVQSQVVKTLVLCYVDVPSPLNFMELDEPDGGKVDVGALMSSYKVREFVVRRWSGNKSRD